ncbi:MAG: PEGA domain-containing protein [Deltaproteobacteria bacterium]|nr:PEGA domain-containing protein [Deltaproteobacteria bacterium]
MKSLARSFVVMGLTLGMATASVSAHAQAHSGAPTQAMKDEAQDRFKRGIQLYEEENFTAALAEFRRAYELVPAYQVLYNVARSCYQTRDYVCALKTFDRYLAEGGAAIERTRRDEVEREIALMHRRVVTINLKATKGATITVDGNAVGEYPLSSPLLVNEGRRQLRATLAGRENVEKMVDLVGGETTMVDLQHGEGSASSSSSSADSRSGSTTHYWLWGTAGLLAVATGITGVLALSASSDASDIRTNGGSLDSYNSAENRMRAFSVTTDVLGIAAIGVGVAALVVTLSRPDSPKTTGKLTASPTGGLVNYGL